MKIAIDCHTLEAKNWAGKGYLLNSTLQGLIKLDKENKYILYFRKPIFKNSLPANWQVRNINLPTPFWQLYVSLDILFKKVNLLFCPGAYLLPVINFLIPTLILIPDITTFLPEIKKTHKFSSRLRERILLRLAILHSQKIITISENTKKDLIHFFHIKPQKIFVVPLAKRDVFYPISNWKKIDAIREKYDLPEKFILFVGTLEPRKNIVRLIEAYHQLIINNKQLIIPKLVIVGKRGWYYQGIFNKVRVLKLEDRIIFLGYISNKDIPYLYNGAVCFVYPSLYEGFGLPPLEAMSCGCPVITSNTSSLPEVVGKAAILIDPYKVDELTAALKKVLTDENLRQNLKQKGLIRAQKFSWQKTVKKILNIFQIMRTNPIKC